MASSEGTELWIFSGYSLIGFVCTLANFMLMIQCHLGFSQYKKTWWDVTWQAQLWNDCAGHKLSLTSWWSMPMIMLSSSHLCSAMLLRTCGPLFGSSKCGASRASLVQASWMWLHLNAYNTSTHVRQSAFAELLDPVVNVLLNSGWGEVVPQMYNGLWNKTICIISAATLDTSSPSWLNQSLPWNPSKCCCKLLSSWSGQLQIHHCQPASESQLVFHLNSVFALHFGWQSWNLWKKHFYVK